MPAERQQTAYRKVKSLAEAHAWLEELLRQSHDGRHVTHYGHLDELVIIQSTDGMYEMLVIWHTIYVISTTQ